MKFLVALFSILFSANVAGAVTTNVYDFSETSSTVPGLTITASITINGTLADLPTIDCREGSCGALNFGPLVALSLAAGGELDGGTITLANFTAPVNPAEFNFPQWSISPSGINFIDARDENEFDIAGFGSSRIYVASDYQSNLGCGESGACFVMGTWVLDPVAVPEPPTLLLMVTAWLAGWRAFWKQWQSPRKRGNIFPITLRERLTMAWRMGGAARMIVRGPPYRAPRYLRGVARPAAARGTHDGPN